MMLVLTNTKFIAYLCTKTTLHTTIEAMNADRVHLRGGEGWEGHSPTTTTLEVSLPTFYSMVKI